MSYFELAKDILKTNERKKDRIRSQESAFSRLEKYIKTYSKTEPSEHIHYFEKVYSDNKRFILLGPQRDAWLTDNGIVISFGEDCGLKTEMKDSSFSYLRNGL